MKNGCEYRMFIRIFSNVLIAMVVFTKISLVVDRMQKTIMASSVPSHSGRQ